MRNLCFICNICKENCIWTWRIKKFLKIVPLSTITRLTVAKRIIQKCWKLYLQYSMTGHCKWAILAICVLLAIYVRKIWYEHSDLKFFKKYGRKVEEHVSLLQKESFKKVENCTLQKIRNLVESPLTLNNPANRKSGLFFSLHVSVCMYVCPGDPDRIFWPRPFKIGMITPFGDPQKGYF